MGKNIIYTRSGDQGTSALVTGRRVSKSDLRLHGYGTVDELNSTLGLLAANLVEKLGVLPKAEESDTLIAHDLSAVQNQLFNLGSRLACDDDEVRERLPSVEATHVRHLENRIDQWTEILPPLRNFILPGGHSLAATAHIARTVCRRCERLVVELHGRDPHYAKEVEYLNRLSDYLFVLARYLNLRTGVPEVLWHKGP